MFSEFQAALKDIFTVTVQKEDELTSPIVATALACMIQKYAYAPRFATHAQCLASFGSSTSSERPSASEMASAGFFHTGRADEAVCGACFVGLRDWQPCDVDPEAVHVRFSGSEGCLYLTTRRILTSVLPLARKNLSVPRSVFDAASTSVLSERLATIAREMDISGSSRCWPVENTRALGYSDDIILLALWRLQTEKGSQSKDWKIDPQGTTELLKTILRVQESGLGDDELAENLEESSEEASDFSEEADSESTNTTEGAELEAVLSSHQNAIPTPQTRLPSLAKMVQWWANKWAPKSKPNVNIASSAATNTIITNSNSPRSILRRKANSTSA